MFRCGMIEMNNVLSLRASGLVCVRPVGNNGVGSTCRQGNRASILASDHGDWTHATHPPFTLTLLPVINVILCETTLGHHDNRTAKGEWGFPVRVVGR